MSMKRRKPILIGCAVGLVAFLVCLALLAVPAVQKSIFLKLISGSDVVTAVDVGSLKIGFGGARLQDLSFETEDAVFHLKDFELEGSVIELALGDEKQIQDVKMSGLVLDLSGREESADANEGAKEAPKILPSLSDVALFKTLIILQGRGDAKVVLSDREVLELTYEIDDIAPAKAATCDMRWTWTEPGMLANDYPGGVLSGEASIALALSSQGVLQGVSVDAQCSLSRDGNALPPFIFNGELKDSLGAYEIDLVLDLAAAGQGPASRLIEGTLKASRDLDKSIYRGEINLDSNVLDGYLSAFGVDIPTSSFSGSIATEYLVSSGALIAELTGSGRYGQVSHRSNLILNGGLLPKPQWRLTGFAAAAADGSDVRLEVSELDLSLDAEGEVEGTSRAIFIAADRKEYIGLALRVPAEEIEPIALMLDSEVISIEHLQAVGAAIASGLPKTEESSESIEAENPFSTKRPVELGAKISRLIIEDPWSLDAVELDSRIDAGVLKLRKMDFNFLSGRFANVGEVGFASGKYNLLANSNLQGMDIQNTMTSLGLPPIVQTTLNGDVEWQAESATLPGLIDAMKMSWLFTAKEGRIDIPENNIMRGLRGASQVAGILGAIMPGQNYLGNFSKILDYADVVTLEELSFQGQRSDDGAMLVDRLAMKGEDFYADASGVIKSTSWSDVLKAATRLQVNLGAKGDVSQLAAKIGLAEGRMRDGYHLWGKTPFQVSGALEQLDFSSLKDWALSKLTGPASASGSRSAPPSKSTSEEKTPPSDVSDELRREAGRLLGGFLEAVIGGE